jgi:4-amino-4-deoxy-L-arabinose transferase-like glycosyltransferase
MRRPDIRTILIVVGALALHWFMAMSVSSRMGVTADEVVHLTGGYSYWKFNDYRLHPENGTLPMRIAALPLVGMDLAFPAKTKYEWMQSKVNLVGDEFFFELGNPVDAMMARARMMIALAGAFTVWLTWRWARGLFGPTAGWIALGLAVFCPAFLAHSGLATSDITMTGCVLAALSLVWLVFHRVTWLRVIGAIIACGLAFLSKMSGVLIVPLIAAMLVMRWFRPAPFIVALGSAPRWLRRRGQIIFATTTLTIVIAGGSLGVLWAGYGFRFAGLHPSATPAEEYYFTWDVILDKTPLTWSKSGALSSLVADQPPFQESTMSRLIDVLRQRRLLPEAYLWGFAHTYKFSRYRPAYFMGEIRTRGWREFFPMAFILKTTLPALLLIAAGVAALVTARRQRPSGTGFKPWVYRATPLLLFFVVYWVMALNMNLNIGHRHILPTYPIFYLFAGAAAVWLYGRSQRVAGVAMIAMLVLHAGDSLLARPFYLSYFQPLAGGMQQGHRYFVDSSYDWGQGLPDLARWIEAKKKSGDSTPIFLTYFGADSPSARGIDAIRFGDDMTSSGLRSYPAQTRPGWYVISATHLRRVYFPGRGNWTEKHENVYRDLEGRLTAAQAKTGARSEEENKQLLSDARDYEVIQFCRLGYFLENRQPHEIVGGSLLVFKLTAEDIAWALHAPRAEMERHRTPR